MEVWGGNEAASALIRTSGLDAHTNIRPYAEHGAGGDVLYVSSCSSGRITRALLADVVGHGSVASETATSLRRLMASSVNILDQAKLVRVLNEEFAQLQQNGRFASAIVASYFRPTSVLTMCNAGHPPPIYYRARRKKWFQWSSENAPLSGRAQPTNTPLGMFGSVEYDLLKTTFEPGDLVLLYSDGVIEATDPNDQVPGVSGLLNILDDLGPVEAAQVIPLVHDALEEWTASASIGDDVSMMMIDRNELKASLHDQMLAPMRFVQHYVTGRG
jgi:serine phosphatase RsbU (regulator of sigma subunit)